MNDQEIRLVIKSVFDNAGTNKSLGDLRILVEETRKGSKLAADALDQWRAAHGKLANQMSNTGGGLAVPVSQFNAANQRAQIMANPPPVIPAAGGAAAGGGINSTVARAAGGTLGSLFGVGGLGMAAAAGGVAGLTVAGIELVGRALRSVIGLFKEWFDSIQKLVAQSVDYELIKTRLDSVANQTRAVNLHNKDLAQSYSHISENVRTVALEIAHLTELQTLQIEMGAKVSDAMMAQQLAENALNNRFNPILRIQEETRIHAEAIKRQMEIELARAELQVKLHEEETKRALEREQNYLAVAAAGKGARGALKNAVTEAEENAKDNAETQEAKIALAKKYIGILKPFAEGKTGPGDMFSLAFEQARPDDPFGFNADDDFTDTSLGSGTEAPTRAIAKLQKAIADARGSERGFNDKTEQAKDALKLQDDRIKFNESKAQSLRTEAESADEAAKQSRKRIELERPALEEIEGYQQRGNQQGGQLQIFNTIPAVNIDGSNGTDATEVLQDIRTLLENIDRNTSVA